MSVLVLGGRPGNIGEAIFDKLDSQMLGVVNDSCERPSAIIGKTFFAPPDADMIKKMGKFKDLVVTLGYTHMEPFDEIEEREILRVIDGSLAMPLLAARRFIEYTQKRDRSKRPSKIVFIGSYAHDHPLTNGAAYCAAKAGLAMATKELAWSMSEKGYRFYIVHPYHVPSTPMGERVVEKLMETRGMNRGEAEEYQRKDLKMPDHLQPWEIADVVHHIIVNDAFEWVGGNGINLYGGAR